MSEEVLTVRVEGKLYRQLQAIAKADDRSLSSLYRKALAEFVERNTNGNQEEGKKGR